MFKKEIVPKYADVRTPTHNKLARETQAQIRVLQIKN
jgi:hypothetical protein